MTMIDDTRAMDEARTAAEGAPGDRLLGGLADRLGAKAGVRAVFAEPITQGNVTVVPVARVRWGFGGGTGTADGPESGSGTGAGGGGGVSAQPVGYIEIGPHGAAYYPITDARPSPAFVLASAIAAGIVLRGLARLIRG